MLFRNRTSRTYKVHPGKVKYVWIADFHDVELSGLCLVGDKLHTFTRDCSCCDLFVTELTKFSPKWFKEVFRQRLFEFCVGYHWTHGPRHRAFDTRKRRTFPYKLYYFKHNKSIYMRNLTSLLIRLKVGDVSFLDFIRGLRDI